MDTSKEYIEMARRAVEVQGLWKPYFGDFLFITSKDLVSQVAIDTEIDEFTICDTHVWLPRQGQLQGMVKEDTDYHTLMKFDTWVFTLARVYDDIIIEKFSMEQLWLAFVMYEKYGKKWDDQDWAKETGKE